MHDSVTYNTHTLIKAHPITRGNNVHRARARTPSLRVRSFPRSRRSPAPRTCSGWSSRPSSRPSLHLRQEPKLRQLGPRENAQPGRARASRYVRARVFMLHGIDGDAARFWHYAWTSSIHFIFKSQAVCNNSLYLDALQRCFCHCDGRFVRCTRRVDSAK